ncbi:MAG: AMP-binding protein [Pseudomonadota bacterium]
MNLAEWLRRTALRSPEAPALFSGAEFRADYAEFARRASAIAATLAAGGVQPGDRVALFLNNCPEYLEAFYGILWAGAATVPINAKLHGREAAWILGNSGARHVFVDAKTGPDLAPHLTDGLAVTDIAGPAFARMRAGSQMARPAPRAADDLAWLFYTSGTTGRPKGVQITGGMLTAMALSYFADVDEVRGEDATLYAAPMSHGAGIYNFMHVIRGARHVVAPSGGFDAAEVLDLAPKIGPVTMFAAPTMVRRLLDVARARGGSGAGLRTIVYAGGPMYEADIREAVEVMGPRFVQVYGQGECPMGITALSRDDVADRSHPRWRARLNSVGRAQSAVEVAILDESGAELPPGETGEIAVRGPTVMSGYWRNPDATAKTIKNGWLWTGDVGRMDADGYVTLQDRSKDMIISGGSNIYPREVEEVILTHEAVREAAVVGQPDPEWGEIVVAFIVCHRGRDVAPGTLDALCLDHIARFKRPKVYRFVDSLPKNNYGKVLKTDLREKLMAEEGAL